MIFGSAADNHEQVGEISFKVAAVCESPFPFQINREFYIGIFELHGADEAAQRSEGSPKLLANDLAAAEPQERRAQRRNEQAGKRTLFRNFYRYGHKAPGLRIGPDAVEENSLSNSAKAMEEKAAGRPTSSNSIEGNGCALDDVVAPCQFRWRRSGTRSVRIPAWVHVSEPASNIEL